MNPTPNLAQTQTHGHTDRCWWNHEQAHWVCPAAAPQPGQPPADRSPSRSVVDSSPERRLVDASPERPLVDVRDMLVVHTAMLREFRLTTDAVSRAPLGSARQIAAVDGHLGLLCDLLHHHHVGEDELLWPPLRGRLPESVATRLDEAEAEHAALDQALDAVGHARQAWRSTPDAVTRDELFGRLSELRQLLAAHLDHEERELLPLAAAFLTPAEWAAVGAAGAASVPKSKLLLVFGMFSYEGDPDVLSDMLHGAPAPVRVLVPRLAPAVYARHARRVHGTARP